MAGISPAKAARTAAHSYSHNRSRDHLHFSAERGADPARGLVDLFSRRNSPTAFITPSGAAELSERCAFARSLCVVARCGWG